MLLWLVAKNSIASGKMMHVSNLSITSRQLEVVNPLAVEDSRSSLIVLHTHQNPLSSD
jgi:hypothetical protein